VEFHNIRCCLPHFAGFGLFRERDGKEDEEKDKGDDDNDETTKTTTRTTRNIATVIERCDDIFS